MLHTLNPLPTASQHVGNLEEQGAFGSEAENISLTNHTILFARRSNENSRHRGALRKSALAVPVFAAPLSSASGSRTGSLVPSPSQSHKVFSVSQFTRIFVAVCAR